MPTPYPFFFFFSYEIAFAKPELGSSSRIDEAEAGGNGSFFFPLFPSNNLSFPPLRVGRLFVLRIESPMGR